MSDEGTGESEGTDPAYGNRFAGPTGAQFGTGSVQYNYFGGRLRPDLSWPLVIGAPPRLADCFRARTVPVPPGRAPTGSGAAAPLPAEVITGPGGVGKTQLAAQYLHRAWDTGDADLLMWVSATSRLAIVEAYASAASRLLGVDERNPQAAAAAFLAWLHPRAGAAASEERRWLIVLDDVSAPADLQGLWPPPSPRGRTLVTTRRRDAALTGPGRRSVPVGLYTPREAVTYLTEFLGSHGRAEPRDELAALAEELGRLPLALSQAATYLLDAEQDCATYRTRLAGRVESLEDVLPDESSLPNDQTTTLAAAWSLSIDRADRLKPPGLAAPMMRLVAMLDPHAVPGAVLTGEPARSYLAGLRPAAAGRAAAGDVGERSAVGALRALHLLSLLDHDPASRTHTVRIHQLIQRAVRDRLTAAERAAAARAAADALVAAWPAEERDTELVQVLRANAAALIRTGGLALIEPDIHPLLIRVGTSLSDAGLVDAAVRHFARLLDRASRHVGSERPSVMAARRALATQRGQRGEVAHAIAELRLLLQDQLRLLGPESVETLTTRHQLIWWEWAAGDREGAEHGLTALLADRMRLQGPDHLDTLETRHNLYHAWCEAGQLRAAADAYRGLVADRLRIQGADHPDTISARHQLAIIKGLMGHLDGARADMEQVVADRVRVQGPDHPSSMTARQALARLHGEGGHPEDAVAELAALHGDRARVLGPDHPDTLATRRSLAHWRAALGRYDEAAAGLDALFADQVRVLGPDHPEVLETRHERCVLWVERARSGFAALAADRCRIQGAHHPDTLRARRSLAALPPAVETADPAHGADSGHPGRGAAGEDPGGEPDRPG